jgi:hypothetical protein
MRIRWYRVLTAYPVPASSSRPRSSVTLQPRRLQCPVRHRGARGVEHEHALAFRVAELVADVVTGVVRGSRQADVVRLDHGVRRVEIAGARTTCRVPGREVVDHASDRATAGNRKSSGERA